MAGITVRIRSFHQSVAQLLTALAGMLLIALVLLDVMHAGLRYLANTAFPWSLEVNLLLLQALAWISASALWLKREHLVVNFLGSRFARLQFTFNPVTDLLLLAGAFWLLPHITELARLYHDIVMGGLPLPGSVKFLPFIVGLLLLSMAALLNLAVVIIEHMNQNSQHVG